MNTLQHSTRWLGLVLACGIIAFTVCAEAKKPPQPPPEPSGPAYQLIAVDMGAFSFFSGYPYYPNMSSDSGALVGMAWSTLPDGQQVQVPAVLPPRIVGDQVQYIAEDVRTFLTEEGTAEHGTCFAMNESGFAVGGFLDSPWRAYLWLPDGTPVDLRLNFGGLESLACDINNEGIVLVGIGHQDEPGETAGVVVPLDLDEDGAPDTWFTDVDADGMNDLYFPVEIGQNFNPLAINEAGQVLAYEFPDGSSYLLTPDFSDADGDGNPWFADVDGDGINDLLVALDPPEPGASVRAVGLNNLGQVVGYSGGHVVRWDFVAGVQIVTDLGALPKTYQMNVGGISDSGRVAGTCRIDLGRRSRLGPWWVIESDTLHELLPLAVNSDGWSDYLERYDSNHYYGINRYDWILGRVLLDGSLRTFVAIPVEQP